MVLKDKGLLKRELYQDQARLIELVNSTKDLYIKGILQEELDRVNKYILICVKRNKF